MEAIENPRNYFNYKSPIGVFIIQYDFTESKWALGINDEIYGLYTSPIAAADDVYCQVTGCYEWDTFKSKKASIPTDINEWEVYSH